MSIIFLFFDSALTWPEFLNETCTGETIFLRMYLEIALILGSFSGHKNTGRIHGNEGLLLLLLMLV